MVLSQALGPYLMIRPMNPPAQTTRPVRDALRAAAAVHTRHLAARFLLRTLLAVLLAIPALMLADVLFQLREIPRLLMVLGLLAVVIGVFLASFFIVVCVRPPALRIARLLESRNPELGSRLVNILQLENECDNTSAGPLTRDLARHAVDAAVDGLDLKALPPLAREPRLRLHARNLAIAATVLAIITIFGGTHVRNEWARFLDPFGDHPPFSLTRIDISQPEAGFLATYGDSLTIEARTSSHRAGALVLTAEPADGSGAPALVLPMAARGDGSFLARLDNITRPMVLTAHTPDHSARSRRMPLDLILTPRVGPARVTIAPPEYTGLPAREMPYRFAAIQALEGSDIHFHLTSNRPLGHGDTTLETGDDPPASMPLAPQPPDFTETTAITTLTAATSGRLTFHLVDEAGNPAAESPSSLLTVTRDQPPAIAISEPAQDALVVEGFAVPLIIDATDDYGLRSMRLHIAVNGEFLDIEPVTFDGHGTRRHRIEHPLDFATHNIKPGDTVTIFAEAVDTRPDPQITRTSSRRLNAISEEEYNEHLRTQSDVAAIAGKYEEIIRKLEAAIAEQERIEQRFADLARQAGNHPDDDAAKDDILREFSHAFAAQHELNQRLENLATEMEEFGRENPVYDFEHGLNEKLAEQAEAIRDSVRDQRAAIDAAIDESTDAPATPTAEMAEAMRDAAAQQLERLAGSNEQAEQDVIQPLRDLAHLHELMKDFERFRQLTEQQAELAGQSRAYAGKPDLNAEDRLALRDIGAAQRQMAQSLENLARRLQHNAEAAEEAFPEAASSARQLANAIDAAGMPGLARDAAADMLGARAADGHGRAERLHQAMEDLFEDGTPPGHGDFANALDGALRLQRGINPGDSLRQMMLSRLFRPLPGEGGAAAGAGGHMASSATDGNPMLLGGESLMDGPIAQSLSGTGDGAGQGLAAGPTAAIDRPDIAAVDSESARRTDTPSASTLLMQYEDIADAYFRRLTTRGNP